MATAFPVAHAGEIKFTYGRPEVFALKFLEPKVYEGSFGPRGMFTAADEGAGERKIWLDYEDARNMVDELGRLGVRIGEPIRVTKIKHARGGGHGFRVERIGASAQQHDDAPAWVREEAPAAPSKIEAQLAQSVAMVRASGPQVFQRPPAPPAVVPAPAANQSGDSGLVAALKAAVDAALAATEYAAGKGMTLAFNEEDIRALAVTSFINARGGR